MFNDFDFYGKLYLVYDGLILFVVLCIYFGILLFLFFRYILILEISEFFFKSSCLFNFIVIKGKGIFFIKEEKFEFLGYEFKSNRLEIKRFFFIF